MKILKRGEHAPSIERKRLRTFSDFSYDFEGFLSKFQGTFLYMSLFSRTARCRIIEI